MQVIAGDRELASLLTRILIPKPIVLITTTSPEGLVNAAPYSLVNVVAVDPPLVGISFTRKRGLEEKDTLHNLRAAGECVLNLVTEHQREAIRVAAITFPAGQSEVEAARLELEPSAVVRPPRLAGAPGQLECRVRQILDFDGARGPGSSFVIADVLVAHWDPERWQGDQPAGFHPLGRLGGDLFCPTGEPFAMKPPDWESWRRGT